MSVQTSREIAALNIGFAGSFMVVELLGRWDATPLRLDRAGNLGVYGGDRPHKLSIVALPRVLQGVYEPPVVECRGDEGDKGDDFVALTLRAWHSELVVCGEWSCGSGVFACATGRVAPNGPIMLLWSSRALPVFAQDSPALRAC